MNEDSAWGPGMMFGVTGPGPKQDRKPIPSDPKKEKGINIKNMNKMKKFLTYQEFVNETKINEGFNFLSQLKNLKGSMQKAETFAKNNGEDLSDLRGEYMDRMRAVVSDMKTFDRTSDEAVREFMDRMEGSMSFSNLTDVVTIYAEKYGINESLEEAAKWEEVAKKYTLKIGEWMRKGVSYTVENIIIPFVKYLLNVLSRLIINIVISIVNALTGKTYKAPDATIFKKEETASSTVNFDDRGYNLNM